MVSKKVLVAISVAIIVVLAFAGLTLAQQVNAKITAPADGATVSGKVTITGTANGAQFGSYKVEFKNGQDWVLTDSVHTTPVDNGTLATWDTTTVADGNYDLRLLVMDATGQYITTQISVKVDNATASAQAEAPRRGCLACHTQFAPDGRYSLGYEAINGAKEGGVTHPTLPNGFKTTYQQCLGCHSSGNLVLSNIVHPAHMFSNVFLEEFTGNCFSCHEVKNGVFTVLVEKQNVNAKGVIVPAAAPAAPAAPAAQPTTAAPAAQPTTAAAPTTAATVAPTTAPATTGTAPAIPSGHPTTGCSACHATGVGGAPQWPANHASFTEAMCQNCHTRKP